MLHSYDYINNKYIQWPLFFYKNAYVVVISSSSVIYYQLE